MLRGRDRELQRARDIVERSGTGTLGAIVIEADAGMGKSVLLDTVTTEAGRGGAAVLSGRAHTLGASVAYGPVAAAVGRYLRALPANVREERVKGLNSLGLLVEDLEITAEARNDPDLARARMFQAVSLFVARLAAHGPVVMAVDDIHWADSGTVELLGHLAMELRDDPVTMIVTARSSELPARPAARALVAQLGRVPTATHLRLGPLGRPEVAAAGADRLGGALAPPLVDDLLARTGGLPLAVDAVIRAMQERGIMRRTDGGWTATGTVDVPDYVVDIYADRLTGLDPDTRNVVTLLAVADGALDETTIDAVVGRIGGSRTSAELAAGAGLVVESSPDRWELAHSLVGDAVGRLVTEGERRRLHLALLHLMAAEGEGALDDVARHALGAGPLLGDAEAAELLARAGRRALARGAPDVATRWLAAAAMRAENGWTGTDAARLHEEAAVAWERCGEGTAALAARGRAVDLLAHTDPAEAGRVALTAALGCWHLGRDDAAVWWSRALALTDGATGPTRLRAHTAQFLDLMRRDRLSEAAALAALVRADLESLDDTAAVGPEAVEARLRLVYFDAVTGRAAMEEVAELDPHVADGEPLVTRVACDGMVIDALTFLGRFTEARDRSVRLLDCLGADSHVTAHSWRPVTALLMGEIATGEWDRAADRLTEITDASAVSLCRRPIWEALLLALRGELDSAVTIATGAAAAAAASGFPGHAAASRVVAAYATHLGGDPTSLNDATPAGRYLVMGGRLVWSIAGEVLAAAGRTRDVAAVTTALRSRARPGSLPHVTADRLDALASGDALALARASEGFASFGLRFEAAQTLLEAAERDRSFADCEALDVAGDLFDHIGAAPWAMRLRGLRSSPCEAATPPSPVPAGDHRIRLTPREVEVADLLTEGLTNGQIAERLGISIRTVTSHLDHIYTKLGIGTRAALVAHVLRGR
ncbi:MAG: AAA family ATPase [Microthrixaceae bacterium]